MNKLMRRPSRISGSGFDGFAPPILLENDISFKDRQMSRKLTVDALSSTPKLNARALTTKGSPVILFVFLLVLLSSGVPMAHSTSLRAISVGNQRAGHVDDSVLVEGSLYLLGRDARGQSRLFRQAVPGAATVELDVLLVNRRGARLLSSKNMLYILGGKSSSGLHAEFEQVDLETLRVTYLPEIPTPRTHAGMVVLQEQLYVAGGRRGWGTVSVIEVFDLKSRKWQTHAPLLQARECELLTFEGKVFALGGFANKAQGVVRFIERLDKHRNQVVGEMPAAVSRYAAVVDAQGIVVVVGDYVHVSQVLRFQLIEKKTSLDHVIRSSNWQQQSAPIAPRRGARAHLDDHGILVVGGRSMGRDSVRIERLVFSEAQPPLSMR